MAARSRPEGGIGAIPTLPVFFKLQGRRVVLAGGALPAVWKADLLAATGADVSVFDAAPCPEMLELAAKLDGALTLVQRDWMAADLDGAALAIGALEGSHAEAFREAAHAAGVPVNVIDVPDLCDFQFGTVIARSPLLIAISTDGAAPVFGQALRARIEALLPADVAAWAQAAKDWRPDLQARKLAFAARRRFWEIFAERALAGSGAGPTEGDRRACLDAALGVAQEPAGSLDLVGLGPGDMNSVTLGAVRALQSADVIVHEAGVDPTLIGLGRREARAIVEEADHGTTGRLIAALIDEGKRVAWAARGNPATCRTWQNRRVSAPVLPKTIVSALACMTCPAVRRPGLADQ